MVTKLSPLAPNVPIVDKDGNPTPYFQRMLDIWLKEKAVAEGDLDTVINDLANLAIDDLTDVDTATTPPEDGDALIWDDANSEWIPGEVSGGGGGDAGVMHLRDLRAASTDGGTFTSGAWQPRVLNTSVSNTITNAVFHTSTVTITIASPGVVTWTAHGLVNGTPVVFSTTGALPTGLTAGTVYFVVSAATDTFQVSATSGGAAINTSGTQSGTHTAVSNQFSLPAGTYDIFAVAPCHQAETHQARLQNLTDATTTMLGTTERTRQTSATDGHSSSSIRGRFTIAATKRFQIEHRCSATQTTTGFGAGNANSWGSVVFLDVYLRRVDTPVAVSANVGTWTLLDSNGAATTGSTWTHSSNVSSVDVINLGAYNEVLIVGRGLTASASGTRMVLVSVNNGSTYYNTSGDYMTIDSAGVENVASGVAHSTGSTAARDVGVHILNLKGAVNMMTMHNGTGIRTLFVASASDINAIRIANSAGGTLNAGSIYVWAR